MARGWWVGFLLLLQITIAVVTVENGDAVGDDLVAIGLRDEFEGHPSTSTQRQLFSVAEGGAHT